MKAGTVEPATGTASGPCAATDADGTPVDRDDQFAQMARERLDVSHAGGTLLPVSDVGTYLGRSANDPRRDRHECAVVARGPVAGVAFPNDAVMRLGVAEMTSALAAGTAAVPHARHRDRARIFSWTDGCRRTLAFGHLRGPCVEG